MEYTEILNTIIMTTITIGLPLLITLIFKYLNAKIGVEKMAIIEQEILNASLLAETAVTYIQQKYPNLTSEGKRQEAIDWLIIELDNRGIELTSEQINAYLEAALKVVKDSFGENWNK
jgi:LL-H family phage holin